MSDVDTRLPTVTQSRTMHATAPEPAPTQGEMPSKMRMIGARLPKETHAQLEAIREKTGETMTALFARLVHKDASRLGICQ